MRLGMQKKKKEKNELQFEAEQNKLIQEMTKFINFKKFLLFLLLFTEHQRERVKRWVVNTHNYNAEEFFMLFKAASPSTDNPC